MDHLASPTVQAFTVWTEHVTDNPESVPRAVKAGTTASTARRGVSVTRLGQCRVTRREFANVRWVGLALTVARLAPMVVETANVRRMDSVLWVALLDDTARFVKTAVVAVLTKTATVQQESAVLVVNRGSMATDVTRIALITVPHVIPQPGAPNALLISMVSPHAARPAALIANPHLVEIVWSPTEPASMVVLRVTGVANATRSVVSVEGMEDVRV